MNKRQRKKTQTKNPANAGPFIDVYRVANGILGALFAPVITHPGEYSGGDYPRPAPAIPEWYCAPCRIDLKIALGTTRGDIPYCPKCRAPMQTKPAGRSVTYGPKVIETTAEDVTHRRIEEGKK